MEEFEERNVTKLQDSCLDVVVEQIVMRKNVRVRESLKCLNEEVREKLLKLCMRSQCLKQEDLAFFFSKETKSLNLSEGIELSFGIEKNIPWESLQKLDLSRCDIHIHLLKEIPSRVCSLTELSLQRFSFTRILTQI